MSKPVCIYPESYRWKWVCVQHPMILIGADQSTPRALETVPPWGGNDVRGYCRKMLEMLEKVRQTPQLKIDFDLSAKELLLFFEEFPEAKSLMRALIGEGRLGFAGCDYAQAHYHEARSESALRQIRYGAKVFKEELDVTADTFMHQETGLFENLPQILRAYGIRKAAIHAFVSSFEFLETPALELCSNFGRLELVRGETFARWRGLDGSEIPIYLPIVQNHLNKDSEVCTVFENVTTDPDFKGSLAPDVPGKRLYPTCYEENRGLYRNGSIIIECPDMVEVSDEYIQNRARAGEFSLLSEALDEEMKSSARMPAIRYYTYWSYCEGEFGEKMFKAYRSTEEALLAAETMQVIAEKSGLELPSFDADSAWDRFLTAQHHDINWFDTQQLKDVHLESMEIARGDAQDYISSAVSALAGTPEEAGTPYAAVFNTLPIARTAMAALPVGEGKHYRVFDGETEIPSQTDSGILCFDAALSGLGYRSYRLEETEISAAAPVRLDGPYTFVNDVMSVTVQPDGRLTSLRSLSAGEQLRGAGNLLRCRETKEDRSLRWLTNENAPAEATVSKGVLFDTVCVYGKLGDIPYDMCIRLPHGAKNTIDFDLSLSFDHSEIGDFYHDESKLCLYWELAEENPDILVDEPFGAVPGRADRPLHAANYVAVTKNGRGLVYRHTGTPKCWVSGGTLANLLAWGSNNFTNRSPWGWSSFEIYDLRLNGTCRYQYSVSLTDTADAAVIGQAAGSLAAPLVASFAGRPLEERTFLTLENTALIPTAVEPRDGEAVVRVYDASGRESRPVYRTDWTFTGKTDAAGNPADAAGELETIRPYEVCELHFR